MTDPSARGVLRRLAALPAVVAAAAIVVMAAVSLVDIVGRSLFGLAVHGTYEIIRICLCASIFFGLVVATMERAHITVDVIDQLAGETGIRRLKQLARLCFLVFLAMLIYAGWRQSQDVMAFGDVTDDLRLSKLVFWSPILTGLCLAAIAAVADLLHPERN
ncbi:MAG: TRAP transporter small permease [Pseudomonadota bacterium]